MTTNNVSNNTNNNGIGFASVLGITFIVLKLTDVIAWSWWWVLSPFWIPMAIFMAALIVIFLYVIASGKKVIE